MSIRENQFPQDLTMLGDLLTESFQYPDNPEWSVQSDELEELSDSIKAIRKIWPLIRFGQLFSPQMRDILQGYLWEEEDQVAGIVLVDRRGSSDSWMVSTVATHPDYRRRGIAHKLVSTSIDLIKERGGERATLDVIAKNLPAYKLYESLGFEHFTSMLDLTYEQDQVIEAPELPEGYRLEETSAFDWERRVELSKRITPNAIQEFEPIDSARFRQPGFVRMIAPLLSKMQNIKQEIFYIYHHEELVGRANYGARTNAVGRHGIGLLIDPSPEHAALAEPLLCWLMHKLQGYSSAHKIEMGLAAWNSNLIEAAYELGFEKRVEYHRLGMKLDV